MRDVPGRRVPVNGRAVYVEESGHGQDWVVFEAGGGAGRTCWDLLLPFLADKARLVAYDRAGRGLSGRSTRPLSIDDMADDLVAMTEAVVPDRFVLVAHSMGGLVARRAAGRLGSRLRGLVLADSPPESSPVFDAGASVKAARRVERVLAVSQQLVRFRPLARRFSRDMERAFPADTYQAMLAEDFNPAGVAQIRWEIREVRAAIARFRSQPPPLPECPVLVLSVARVPEERQRRHAVHREHQRRYADSLPDGRYEVVDSTHSIHVEQPQLLAARILELLGAA